MNFKGGFMGFVRMLLSALLLAVLLSCGTSSNGEFDYGSATATVDSAKNPLLADLAKWAGAPCNAALTPTISNEIVNFTLATTANNQNGSTHPVVLKKATITFSPADTQSPALPALYSPIYQNLNGYTIPVGGTLTVPLEIVTHNLKQYLTPTLVCQGNSSTYSYNVTIAFDAVEQVSEKSGSIPASMTVRLADFVD